MEQIVQYMNGIFPRAASLGELYKITKYARHELDLMFNEDKISQVNRKKNKVPHAFLLKNTDRLPSHVHFQSAKPDLVCHNVLPTLIFDECQIKKMKANDANKLELPDTFL